MAMTGYSLTKGVIDKVEVSSAAEVLAAARLIAGHATDLDDLLDVLWVLGISKKHLAAALLEERMRLW